MVVVEALAGQSGLRPCREDVGAKRCLVGMIGWQGFLSHGT